MAASGRWGRDRLRKEIDGLLFERTAISGKPDEFIKKELTTLRDDNVMSPDLVFKSPYFLEFAGLKGFYSENQYMTELPPREVLQHQIQKSLAVAKARLANYVEDDV